MLSAKIQKAFNEQINAELYSSYLYLAMAAYLHEANLPGFAHWMNIQAQEELFHAMKFYNYVVERGGRVELEVIAKPPVSWDGPLDVLLATQKHEAMVTARINDLMDLVIAEKDHASVSFLRWFVDEQVEEEDSVQTLVQRLKLIGSDGGALYLMDRDLATRVFTPPAQ
ncbi:MAG: ferritin [Desulfomicrobiaceae bacterium]